MNMDINELVSDNDDGDVESNDRDSYLYGMG